MSFYANYHTHTPRCHHASGTEREYIENAIANGMKILGFSDHCPYFFGEKYFSRYRVQPEEVDDYFRTLTDLKAEYANDIEIHIGFETEYYPTYFGKLMDFLSDYPLEYIIMGQHALGDEPDGPVWCQDQTDSEEKLAQYTAQVIEGLETGRFSYIAHPDILNFTGSDETYRKHMKPFCERLLELDIPLGFNLISYSGMRHYPSERFFRIAAEVGNEVVFESDAHSPETVYLKDTVRRAEELCNRLGINKIDEVILRKPI